MSETSVGREPVVYVQIDQDLCNLTYSESPCTAGMEEYLLSAGSDLYLTTGSGEYLVKDSQAQKCFNTRATCQDPDNYDRGSLTLTFRRPDEGGAEDGMYAIPSVTGISTTPTELNPGAGGRDSSPLGARATCRVTFQDHPHSDNLVDPYRTERNYIATDRGTFWGKWIARNPYYNNRRMRIYEGYRGQSLAEMQVRTYIIDSIDGPGSNGRVTVKGKDVLKLADNDKAVAPAISEGELIVDINETTTADLRITGADATAYPAPGTVRVGDELIGYTGVTTIDAEEIRLTGITRATDGSEAESHDGEDRVQYCLRYTNTRVDALAYEWLTEYGNVPTGFIDLAAWQAEASVWLAQFELTGLITEPTGVTDLLGEITEQCLFYIWWDERVQLIRLEAIKPPVTTPPQWSDDNNIIEDSKRLQMKPSERISQVWVYWGQIDPTQDLDDQENFRRLRVRADLAAQSDEQYGESVIRRIYSRWLQTEGQAINITTRLLSRYRDNPRYLTISADAKDREQWTGDVLDITQREVTDFTGEPLLTRWQIISADEVESGHMVRYQLLSYEYGVGERFGTWMAAAAPTYADANDTEKATGMWWSGTDGAMPNGDPGYNWQ